MKAYRFTISGYYTNSKKEVVDFENITGIVPATDYDVALMHVRGRFARLWVANAKNDDGSARYPERIAEMGQVHDDKMEEIDHDFSFVGKDIKEMTDEELQHLSVYKDLRRIPFPARFSGSSIREMRILAYCEYSDAVLGTDLLQKKDQPEFKWYDMPPLVVVGGKRVDNTIKLTNDDILELEQAPMGIMDTPKSNLTIDDLRDIARKRNISFSKNISFDDLYAKLFS